MFSIGIDCSRCRSGGSKAHIIGILSQLIPTQHDISYVHIWSYQSLLDCLPEKPWLIKHNHIFIEKNIATQLIWQFIILPFHLLILKCNILFTADSSSVCLFSPSVVLNQDILAYEPNIVKKYRFRSSYYRLICIKYIQNFCMKRASAVIFLSKYASKLVQKSTGKLPNFVHIPHGIDEEFRKNLKTSHNQLNKKNNEPIKFIYVSNTDIYKNQTVVVEAVSLLREAGYNIDLDLIGGGSGKPQVKLKAMVKKCDPNNEFVKLRPFVKHSSIPKLLAKADVFVFASSVETWGITLAEAMAVGLPILCSNRSSLPEVLGDCGIYFDPESTLSLYNACLHLFSNPDLFYKLAKAARSRSSCYTWANCAKLTFDFIRTTYISS